MSNYASLVSEHSTAYKSAAVLNNTAAALRGFSKNIELPEMQTISVNTKYPISNSTAIVNQNEMLISGLQANHPIETLRLSSSINEETTIIPTSIGRWFTITLVQKIQSDAFVAGESSASEEYIEAVANEHGWPTTMNWLNTIYLDYFSNSTVLIGLMHCLSHFKFEDVKPAGPTMALGVLQHEDIYVRDYAIRAFENWNDKEAITILKTLSCDAKWLQDYVNDVINALEG